MEPNFRCLMRPRLPVKSLYHNELLNGCIPALMPVVSKHNFLKFLWLLLFILAVAVLSKIARLLKNYRLQCLATSWDVIRIDVKRFSKIFSRRLVP